MPTFEKWITDEDILEIEAYVKYHSGKATVTIGSANIVGRTSQHCFVGGGPNAWMFLSDSNSTPPSGPESAGAVSPAVFAFDEETYGLTFSNKTDDVDVNAEFYKNGTLLFTWQVRNAHTATKTTALSALVFVPGDRLSIFLEDVGTGNDVDQATIEVFSTITSTQTIDTNTQII